MYGIYGHKRIDAQTAVNHSVDYSQFLDLGLV